jgi:hypothetical protein
MYYHDPDLFSTPFGDVKIDHNAPSRANSVPKDVSPEAEGRAAGNLKSEISTDKSEIVFTQGMQGSESVVIHNGFIGDVDIEADIVGDYGAYSVQPGRSGIGSGKDVTVTVSYKPLDRLVETNLRVRVQPFGHFMMIPIRLKSATASQ